MLRSNPSAAAAQRATRRRSRLVALIGALILLACGAPPRASSLPAAPDPDAFRLVVPSPGPRPDVPGAGATEFVLPNGFRVWGLAWNSGTVALEVRCLVGSGSDPEGQAGVTSLLARMFTEGTKSMTALEQAMAFESLGASLEHDASSDTVGVGTEVLPNDAGRAVALLGEAIRRPRFGNADFERIRNERLDDLKGQRQDPEQIAWLIAQRAAFGPLRGRPESGTPKDVAKLRASQLVQRHQGEFGPERCALFAAGSHDQRALEDAAQAAFGDWPKRAAVQPKPVLVPQQMLHAGEVLFLGREDAVQSAFVIASALPNRMDPGYHAREVINDLFGGLFTSRLNTNLRERHAYTYGAASRTFASRDLGAWFLSTSVHTDVTAAALGEAHGEVARLAREPATAQEIARARADLIQRRRSRLEHNTRLLADLSEALTFDLPLDHSSKYPTLLDALAREELDSAARQLSSGPFVTVVVGAKPVESTLSELGMTVKPVDPTWLE
jgi:zinc protease